MRPNIREFVRLAGETLPIAEPVYEFGSYQVAGQEQLSDLRPLFAGREFVGCDMRPGPGVDRVLDLHRIDLPDATAGTVLSLDTLEHVEDPRTALAEIHRVLRPGGLAIISSVMDFPIHDHPSDYWRFTPEAFRSILAPFADCWVGASGRSDFPHTVVGIGFKGEPPPLGEFLRRYDSWRRRQPWAYRVQRLVPPAALDLRRALRDRLRRG